MGEAHSSSAAGGLRGIWQQERCNGFGPRRFEHKGVAFETLNHQYGEGLYD
jgi:hypothetical protein